ncbi:DUF559 domain-containing protein [Gordonia sp. VNQ95]|jgi:hypothetical protein|uniref:endonuclease domain-containing protein n=1 Tax=Gordonia TaxID=2053 RepID=UPI0032B53CB4
MTIEDSTSPPSLITRQDAMSVVGMSAERFAAEFRRVRGGAHISRAELMTARERVVAIASQAQGNPVVAGQAAMVMHGAKWFDAGFDVVLIRGITASGRPALGTTTWRLDLPAEHVVTIDGIAVTSPIRTAFDVGRIQPRMRAIGHLDTLAAATGFDLDELAEYAKSQKRTRHVRQVRGLAPLVNRLHESPRESSTGLFMHDCGLPTPVAQFEVFNEYGILVARHDWAYPDLKIAIEYDGEDYHSSPEQQASDAARDAESNRLQWKVIRANNKRMTSDPMGLIAEIAEAIHQRGGYYS